MITTPMIGAALAAALFLNGCSGAGDATPDAGSTPQASTPGGPLTPDAGGQVIEVEMVTDGDGNFFGPAELEVRRGDVIRWKLVSGVHNASFPTDSNPGAVSLPTATPMLQLPGQTYDAKVDMAPGRYYYHCDPHALLGMVGWLTVQ